MSEYLAIVSAILAMCIWGYVAVTAIESYTDGHLIRSITYGSIAVLLLAWMIMMGIENEAKHPCVTYESRMTYNAATKTMMPLRVCVERGTWEAK